MLKAPRKPCLARRSNYTESAARTQERRGCRREGPGPELPPSFYHTQVARAGPGPRPPQSCGKWSGGLESSSELVSMQRRAIPLGSGASGDPKDGGKDYLVSSRKMLLWPPQDKKLAKQNLKTFSRK